MPIDDKMKSYTNKFINYINDNLLKDQKSVCHELELDKINSVYLVNSNFKHDAKDPLNFTNPLKLNLAKPVQVKIDYEKYLFQVRTKPNDGHYEFSVLVEKDVKTDATVKIDASVKIDSNLISRINKYGKSDHCIHDTFPNLRAFCYCRKQL